MIVMLHIIIMGRLRKLEKEMFVKHREKKNLN